MKKTLLGMTLISFIIIVSIVLIQTNVSFSTVSVDGASVDCERVFSGYTPNGYSVKTACENEGYACEVDTRQGTFGTIYTVECAEWCYLCSSGVVDVTPLSGGCSPNNYEELPKSYIDEVDGGGIIGGSVYQELCNAPDPIECYQCDGSSIAVTLDQDGSCDSGWTSNFGSLDCSPDEPDDPVDPNIPPQQTKVTCFVCEGSNLVNQQFDNSCPSGWQTSAPSCYQPPTQVTCYFCAGKDLVTTSMTGSCGSGFSTTPLSCASGGKTCYACDGNSITTKQFDSSCPTGWSEQQPSSCNEQVDCFTCNQETGNIERNDFTNECPEKWNEELPTDCSKKSFLAELFDFENNPTQSSILIVALSFLVFSLVGSFLRKK